MADVTETYHTWTKHIFVCTDCSLRCYATQEAIDEMRRNSFYEEGTTDAQVAEGFDFCLSCLTATEIPGERVLEFPSGHRKTITSAESQQFIDGDNTWLKGAVWELRGLTPEDVRNLDAAADFLRDAPEDWGDTEGTVAKIVALVGMVKKALED